MPTALKHISWKFYMINGGWDILMLVIIVMFWVETKGKTLEEVDYVIDGHSQGTVWSEEHMPRNEGGAEVVTKGGPPYAAGK
jgi:Sugar (and other) transporter